MIVDSSAIVAIHEDEPEGGALLDLLHKDPRSRISAATYVECAIVLDNLPSVLTESRLDQLLEAADIEVVPFTPEQARAARRAHHRFGRGSGHPAKLNLGDCFAYALAIAEDEPLLFNGNDFTHTDVRDASAS